MNIPTVACKAHMLNLFVNNIYIADYQLLIKRISKVIVICRHCLNRALLRKLNKLSPIKMNDTRWNSKYYMLKRFLELIDDICEIFDIKYNTSGKVIRPTNNYKTTANNTVIETDNYTEEEVIIDEDLKGKDIYDLFPSLEEINQIKK